MLPPNSLSPNICLTGLIGNILKEVITQAIADKKKRLDERAVENIVAAYLARHQIAIQPSPIVKEIYVVMGASGLVSSDGRIILSPTEPLSAVIGRVTHQVAFYNAEGDVLQALNRYEEALAAYNRALELSPKDPAILNNKGDTLRKLKRHGEALLAYEQATQFDSTNAAIFNNKGDVLQVLNRHGEAVIAYDQALQFASNDPAILNNKGDALQTLHRYQEAVEAYDHALRLSNDSAIYSNKQEALRALDRERGRQ